MKVFAKYLHAFRAKDYAYGFNSCYQLAQGTFDRSCVPYAKDHKNPLCPVNGVEGVCPPERSSENADSYSFVAAGIYFSEKCNILIPLPPLPAAATQAPVYSKSTFNIVPTSSIKLDITSSSASIAAATLFPIKSASVSKSETPITTPVGPVRRQSSNGPLVRKDSCPIIDDYIVFDGEDDDDETLGLDGYVHFGDSFGAGMGTGSTSWDACRVGSNNYGDLLYKWFNVDKLPLEKKVCSGDTTKGLNRQINEWKDPSVPNVGTVSMGGNDLGFSDLVWYCVITPNTARLGSTNRKNCLDAQDKAKKMMGDVSNEGLRNKLQGSYVSILEKSGREVSHL